MAWGGCKRLPPFVGNWARVVSRSDSNLRSLGTKFGVHVFAADQNGYQKLGSMAVAVAAFAGPGGRLRDRVYVVDPAGYIKVLVLK